MRRLCDGPWVPSPAWEHSLSNYDFAHARRQALMLVVVQAAIAAVVAVVCAGLSGAPAALSALVGGGIGVAASLAQVVLSFRARAAGNPAAIARGFYRGEALKIAVTVMLFVIALRARRFMPGALFAGYVATFVAYWLALARAQGSGTRK
jgi:ATP synthase protein I